MATQSTVVRTHIHRSMLMVLGLVTMLTTVLIGGWVLRPTIPTTAPVPVTSMVIPASTSDRPVANRFFANEIGGAGAPDLTSAASGVQPEWEQVQLRHTAPVVVGLQPGIVVASRFFADEIDGAGALDLSSATSGMQPEWAEMLPHTVAPVAAAPQFASINRIFTDEIAAGAGLADGTLPEVPAMVPWHGPR